MSTNNLGASRIVSPLFFILLLAAAFFLDISTAQSAAPRPVVIGRTVSKSGAFQGESKAIQDGFAMWLQDVTARGGILMTDGERHPVQVITYNDASDTQVARVQTKELIEVDDVDVIVGPFGGAMCTEAVKQANRTQTPTVYAAGSSNVLFTSGFQHSFSISAQIGPRQKPCIDLYKQLGVLNFEMIVANDSFQITAANAFSNQMHATGIPALFNYSTYPVTEENFVAHRQRWANALQRPELVLIGGALPFSRAALLMVREIYDPKAIFMANGPAIPPLVAEFDWEAENIFQGTQWSKTLPYTDEYYGNTSTWAAAFQQRTNLTTEWTHAASYTSGYVIEKAFEFLYSPENATNQEKNEAIRNLSLTSLWGPIEFLPTGEIAGQSICQQVQRKNYDLIVAPDNLRNAEVVFPAVPNRPPPPKYSKKEILLMKVLIPLFIGLLLLAVLGIIILVITKKYHFVTIPKNNANDEWGK